MVQNQWRLGGKSASQGRFSESHITNKRRRSGRGGFSTDSTLAVGGGSLAQAQCLFRRLLAYSYSNDLGLYAEEIDGRTGDAQAVFGAILGGFVSAQLMNCRGRGGTDFYRFLCLRLVRSGTVADRATPCAPAPKGRLYEAAFTSSNRR